MKPYALEMREHLLPMLRSGHIRETAALPAGNKFSRLTASQRRQVEALSTERGYRPFQAWRMSK